MKKIYVNPQTKAIIISTQKMLAASNPEDGFQQGTAQELPEEVAGGNMSRYFDYDEDEE
jgi:hypothetical protein